MNTISENETSIMVNTWQYCADYMMLHNADFSFFLLFLFWLWDSSISLILLLFWLCRSNINSWLVSSSFLFCKLRLVWFNEVSRVSKCLYFCSEFPQLQEQAGAGAGAENRGACFSKSLSKCNFNFSNWNETETMSNVKHINNNKYWWLNYTLHLQSTSLQRFSTSIFIFSS